MRANRHCPEFAASPYFVDTRRFSILSRCCTTTSCRGGRSAYPGAWPTRNRWPSGETRFSRVV